MKAKQNNILEPLKVSQAMPLMTLLAFVEKKNLHRKRHWDDMAYKLFLLRIIAKQNKKCLYILEEFIWCYNSLQCYN